MEELVKVKGSQFTKPKVMQSAAGYYVGWEALDEEINQLVPGGRFTGYMGEAQAQDLLTLYSDKDSKELFVISLVSSGVPEDMARRFVEEG